MIFTKKNKEGVRAIRAIKYKNYVAGKYTRARAPLARMHTNRIFESKDGTTSIKIVNSESERHNFCFNDFLTKSNRTKMQTNKVEERTFGTPCSPLRNLEKVKYDYAGPSPMLNKISGSLKSKGEPRVLQCCKKYVKVTKCIFVLGVVFSR